MDAGRNRDEEPRNRLGPAECLREGIRALALGVRRFFALPVHHIAGGFLVIFDNEYREAILIGSAPRANDSRRLWPVPIMLFISNPKEIIRHRASPTVE
jgi:hypothetical protein